MAVRDRVEAALRTVIDPCCKERQISVVDMGLVHDIEVSEDGRVHVQLMLTSGWCPFQTDLLAQVEDAVGRLEEVEAAQVSITLEEAWSTARLSADATAKLRFLPDPREVGDRDRYLASLPLALDMGVGR
jgi:metal-sulfur cluster biosynthetic enzyme